MLVNCRWSVGWQHYREVQEGLAEMGGNWGGRGFHHPYRGCGAQGSQCSGHGKECPDGSDLPYNCSHCLVLPNRTFQKPLPVPSYSRGNGHEELVGPAEKHVGHVEYPDFVDPGHVVDHVHTENQSGLDGYNTCDDQL